MEVNNLRLIFWEITQNCNLYCPYCRRTGLTGDLSWEESLHIIDSIVENYQPLLIFSGGEPLLYPYLFEVAAYACKKGLTIALATNATLIDQDLAERIKSVGFKRVSVSLDGATEEINDSLRGKGTFLKTLRGIRNLKSCGIDLQLNTTIFRRNLAQLPLLYELCLALKLKALHIFVFVPVGCGITVPRDQRLSPEECENFLNEMAHLSLESKLEIKVTCAPHYQRIIFKRQDNTTPITKGCLAGNQVCFISSTGEVYPCGYLKLSAGNIFKDRFKKIWEDSHLFQTLRKTDYLKGKCRVCEYVAICGGCRARAYALTGNYLEEEPDCSYQPLSAKS